MKCSVIIKRNTRKTRKNTSIFVTQGLQDVVSRAGSITETAVFKKTETEVGIQKTEKYRKSKVPKSRHLQQCHS